MAKIDAAFWLGLESLRALTSEGTWQLLVKLRFAGEDDDDEVEEKDDDEDDKMRRWTWIVYDDFSLDENYSLTVGGTGARLGLDSTFDPFRSSDRGATKVRCVIVDVDVYA